MGTAPKKCQTLGVCRKVASNSMNVVGLVDLPAREKAFLNIPISLHNNVIFWVRKQAACINTSRVKSG